MKVINPNDTSHTLEFIPRFYPDDITIFELKDEVTKEIIELTHTYANFNGILYVYFDYTFTNKQKFQIKITQVNDIVYRGKLSIKE